MRKAALAILLFAQTLFRAPAADGTISFLYFASGTPSDQPIKTAAGRILDSTFTVALYAGNQLYNDSALPLATTPIFQTTGLFQYPGGDIAIPGSTPGEPAIVTLKAWDGPSYSSPATFHGAVSFVTLPLGGPNPNPPPPAFTSPDLSGPTAGIGFHGGPLYFPTFPEPSTYALAVLGLAALAISRPRNSPK